VRRRMHLLLVAGLVGWTSRVCAAARAIETEQPDALYQDPLAEDLAGSDAIEFAKQRMAEEAVQATNGSTGRGWFGTLGGVPNGTEAGHTVGRFGIRVKYLDDAILRATRGEPVPLESREGDGAAASSGEPVRQVVLLGAGMDTRAWRLPLDGVRWYEVDVESVLDIKKQLLSGMGAHLEPGQGDPPPRHPLTAASYAAAAGDLADNTWADALKTAGWMGKERTLFVAEGLVRYLKAPVLEAMFRTAAQEAAPDSIFLATMHSRSGMEHGRAERSMEALAQHVHWGYPDDPAEMKVLFEGLGWVQTGFDTTASVGRQVAGSIPLAYQPSTTPDPENAEYLFFVAQNVHSAN